MDVLQLPSVPVSKILSHLDFTEVIHLAFLSKRATNMVLDAGSSSITPPTARLCFGNRQNSISLFRTNCAKFMCYFRESVDYEILMTGDPDEPRRASCLCKSKVINGVKKLTYMHGNSLLIIGAGADDFLLMVKFLKRIFGFRVDYFGLRMENGLRIEHDFQRLMIETKLFHKGNCVGLDTTGLSIEHLAFIVDNCRFEEFSTHGSLPEGFQYGSKLSRYQKLYLDHSSERGREVPGRIEEWITMDTVSLVAESGITRQMELYPLNYTSEDLNGFIKNWLASDNWTFEYLKLDRLRARKRSDPLDQRVVFNGILTYPGTKKSKTAKKKYESRLQFEKGTDIRRKDGLWATVLFYKNNDQKEVHFVVWYDENPNA